MKTAKQISFKSPLTYVYLSYEKGSFDKSSDLQRSQLSTSCRVDARKDPVFILSKRFKDR
jgi:hypothetical protein